MNILFIDDDEDDYILVKSYLSDTPALNFHLEWAKSPAEGLEAILRFQYDLCLLDFKFGGEVDGLGLLQELNKYAKDIPIIFLTNYMEYEIDAEAMKLGAMDYLVKGQIDANLLERSIRHSIARKCAENELKRYRDHLEELIAERTAELELSNKTLQLEIAERKRAEEEKSRLR